MVREVQPAVSPVTYLAYAGHRYLKAAVLLVAVAVGAYIWLPGDRTSGDPLGRSLGWIGVVLILWLTAFAFRKRKYDHRGAPLRGWLSAHVYLGTALVIVILLHATFKFPWNVDTFSFIPLLGTVITGLVGVGMYYWIPSSISRNNAGQSLEDLEARIVDIDAQCRRNALEMSDEIASAIKMSIEDTEINAVTSLNQLLGRVPNCATSRALEELESPRLSRDMTIEERNRLRNIIGDVSAKKRELIRFRRAIQYKALLDIWLVFHIPLAIGTLIGVAIHVFVHISG